MTWSLTELFPDWRRLLAEVWAEYHIVALGLGVLAIGLTVYAFFFYSPTIAAIVLLVFSFSALLIFAMFFLIAVVFQGSPRLPRTSAIARRVLGAGLFGTIAYLGVRSALAQWSYDRPKAIGAWLLATGFTWLAVTASLDRKPLGGRYGYRDNSPDRDA